MTISSQTSRISYTGNSSTTVFSIPFYFAANADIVVYVQSTAGVSTLQTLGTNYTLTGATLSAGGTCTFVTAPTTGYTVIIYRDPALTQTTSYNNNDPFPASSHELALDKAVTIDQRTRDLVARAVHLPDGDSLTSLTLASVASRKNLYLGFGDDGDLTYGVAPVTLTVFVADRTTLKALNTTSNTTAMLREAGREGMFVWRSGDYSAQVTNDPNEGVYVKATTVASSAGAWVRQSDWHLGVDPRWFGAVFDWNGSTGTDDSAAIQAWINFLAYSTAPGRMPGLRTRLNAPVNISSVVTIFGNPLKSEFRITHNGKGLNITAQCTLDGFRVVGDLSGAKSSQYLIHIEGPTNLVHLKNLSLDGGYRNLNVNGTVFYLYLHRVTWYDAVDRHFNALGDATVGFDVIMSDCEQITPTGSTCVYGMIWEKLGSAIVTNFRSSPAKCTSDCLRIISLATLYGDSRFSNCVFEGGMLSQIRLDGVVGAGNEIKSMFFDSCYAVGASAAQPAVNLGYVKNIQFVGGQYGGSQAAFQVTNEARSVGIANCVSEAAGKFITASASAVIDTFDVSSCVYKAGTAAFLDFSAATTALNVTVTGGHPGTIASPILMPSGQYANCRVTGLLNGANKFSRYGSFGQALGGATSAIAIPHGLMATPTYWNAINSSFLTGSIFIREVTADATNINVQLSASPTAATYTFIWEARL